jgi:MarR family transcriptional regulator, 2-MHQ and catechol-resistance regulon repressor
MNQLSLSFELPMSSLPPVPAPIVIDLDSETDSLPVSSAEPTPGLGTQQTLSAKAAAQAEFMPTMRELARTYQAFANYSDIHIRSLGLTSSQFDVIATLGGTNGMNMKEVAERTLVTKGTLTGIIDRLEKKRLVRRTIPRENRRSFILSLTEEGEALFQVIFPAQIQHLQDRFNQLDSTELATLEALLRKLRMAFK